MPDKQIKYSRASSNDEEKQKSVYDFEVVLEEIGGLGRYQFLLVLMVYYIGMPTGINQVASVFESATPDYRCALPPFDDNLSAYNLTEEMLRNLTLPPDTLTGGYSQCLRYDYNLSGCNPNDPLIGGECIPTTTPSEDTPQIACDEGFWYDTSIYTSTTVTEFDLTCEKSIISTVVSSIYFVGVLLSSVVGGNLVDMFGRTPVMLVSEMTVIAIGISCAFAPSLVAYAVLRFGISIFLLAGYVACFVYVVEVTGKKWRTAVGITVQTIFAFGYMSLSAFGYIWRDWRQFQFAISLVPVPFLLIWWFIPESPRWLLANGQIKKGKKISEQIARRNGNALSADVWVRSAQSGAKQMLESGKDNVSPIELFRRPKMRWITIKMLFCWFVSALVYYGLSLNAGSLAGSAYVNNVLSGVSEIIGCTIVIFTLDYYGRKPSLSICLLIGGLSCLGATAAMNIAGKEPAGQTAATVLAMIGKLAVSGAFAIVYNYTAELYPTVVRSTAVGLGSSSARLGSVFTPFTLGLQYSSVPWLTSVIFGVLSLIAGYLSLSFPETLNMPMMTTLDEAEEFYKGNLNKSSRASSSTSDYSDEEKDPNYDLKSTTI